MTIIGNKNSHIQIPKSVLFEFSKKVSIINHLGKPEKPDMIFIMDLKGNIYQENIKKVNTCFGYYENIVETELLAKAEKLFGDAKLKLINAAKGQRLNLNQIDIEAIELYCYLCLIRSPEFVKEVRKKSIFIDLLENSPQNTIMYTFFSHPKFNVDFLKGYNMYFVKNISNINFILPQLGIIGIKVTNMINNYFIPITPKLAILLSNDGGSFGKKNRFKIIDDKNVDNLNKFAIYNEKKHNKCAIYAQEKSDLERYKNFLLK